LTTSQARKGDYTPEQWANACILHWGSSDAAARSKNNHAIPVKKPDGTADPELMKAAAKALINSDIEQAQRRDAARVLVGLYRRIDDNPPDGLLGLAGMVGRAHDYSGGLDAEDEAATGAADFAELDRRWVELRAEVAAGPENRLYPAEVAAFAAERGLTISEGTDVLQRALRGEYEGDPTALRASTTGTVAARRKADREETSLGLAAIGLSGTATEGGSERIAALADAYAEEHQVPYEVAVVEVQRGRR
jgi:hypothetical protein